MNLAALDVAWKAAEALLPVWGNEAPTEAVSQADMGLSA